MKAILSLHFSTSAQTNGVFLLSKNPQGTHPAIDMDDLSGNPATAIGKQMRRGHFFNLFKQLSIASG